VDAGGNLASREERLQRIAMRGLDDVEVEHVRASHLSRRDHDVPDADKPLVVLRGDSCTARTPAIKVGQLDRQEARLNRVEASVQPKLNMIVFRGLPAVPKATVVSEADRVIARDCAPITECPEVLSRIEAEAAGRANRAGPGTAVEDAVRLGRIFEDGQPLARRDLGDWGHVGNLPVQVDLHYCTCSHCDSQFDLRGVKCVRGWVTVHEDRGGPDR
jgi:hypothetical protein